jgi:hypothetical protein
VVVEVSHIVGEQCEPHMAPDRLQRELATFEARKASLLPAADGKFVLIHGDDLSVWETYEDALRAGYEKYGVDTPFLVKQVSGFEQVHFFTRDIACQS